MDFLVSLPLKINPMDLSKIPQISHTDSNNFFLLAGPCAIEGKDMARRIAEQVLGITDKLSIPYVFKGSFKRPIEAVSIVLQGLGTKKH